MEPDPGQVIRQQAETIRQQAQTIRRQEETIRRQEQIIARQQARIAELEQRVAQLTARARGTVGPGGSPEEELVQFLQTALQSRRACPACPIGVGAGIKPPKPPAGKDFLLSSESGILARGL